jgi:hypothetical protein
MIDVLHPDQDAAASPLLSGGGQMRGDEATPDDPHIDDTPRKGNGTEITEADEDAALLLIKDTYKMAWADARRELIRKALRAFEVLKNNPYSVYNTETNGFDSLSSYMSGAKSGDDPEIYQYSDNIYQMLCLAYVAALAPDVPKTRTQPATAKNELDLIIAKKGSTIMAFVERLNGVNSLQKLELLYLWVSGSYYCYIRAVVDAARAGTSRKDIYELKMQTVVPEMYLCPACGEANIASQVATLGRAQCQNCHGPLGPNDLHPAIQMEVPTVVGHVDQPNTMTAMDIFSVLNVDADPGAESIEKSPILDLVGEIDIATVRASYPEKYDQIQPGLTNDGSQTGETDAMTRARVKSPGGARTSNQNLYQGTYSRCWIQAFAFNMHPDKKMAEHLTKKYPNGAKVVSFGEKLVLQKVSEKLTDHWTHCAAVPGMGLNPFGVGEAALDVQDRINDAANNIHAYMERIAVPPILFDAEVINGKALAASVASGGTMFPVYRKTDAGAGRVPMSELMYQPTYHVDQGIYKYGSSLVQLAQLIVGVQPQVYGGSDPHVETAQGQNQMLQTAMGRMSIYIDQMRWEKAKRMMLAVYCTVRNLDDKLSIVVEGDIEGDYKDEEMLADELQGQFHAYPEADQGFPASYAEIQQRLMTLLQAGAENPFIKEILDDPDNAKVLARYILPDDISIKGDAMRSKAKMTIQKLVQPGAQAMVIPGPTGPVVLPSILPDKDIDDMDMIVDITRKYLQEHYDLADQNPKGFQNALAYLRIASQYSAEAAAKAAFQAHAAAGGPPGLPAPAQPG